jgi:effector-binding domain-containing protein
MEIIEKEIGQVIELEENVSMFQMPGAMGKNFKELMTFMESKNIKCTDVPYARYVNIDLDSEVNKGFISMVIDMFTRKWHFFSGFSVPEKVEVVGRIKHSFIPKQKYIKAIHKGHYHKVGDTYKKIHSYIKSEGIKVGSESFEFYMNDPHKTKPEDLETVVLMPVV